MNDLMRERRLTAPAPKDHRLRAKAIVTVFALLLLVEATCLADLYGRRLTEQLEVLGRTTAESSASALVKSYLTTLATGDADAALALSQRQPTDRALLTDEDLAWSQARFPIHEIRVGPVHLTGRSAVVETTYQLGELRISRPFFAVSTAGRWKIESAFATVDLTPLTSHGLPLEINDVPRNTTASVFPGAHRLSTGLDLVDFASDDVWLVESPDETWLPHPLPAPEVTLAGETEFLRAGLLAVQACAAQKSMAPPGCPFAVQPPADLAIDPVTERWEVDPSWLTGMAPHLRQDAGTSWVQAGVVLDVRFSVDGTRAGASTRFVRQMSTFVTITAPITVPARSGSSSSLTVILR